MAPYRSFPKLVSLIGIAIALATGAAMADPLPDPRAPGDGFLHFPGLPPIPFRSDNRIMPLGPGNQGATTPPARKAAAAPPKPLTPAEKAETIRKALAPRPPVAQVRRQTLDELYTKLASSRDPEEAKGLATLIGGIWMRSDSDTANLLMQRVVASIGAKNYPLALKLLDRLVEVQPNWPEAWNKRASVRYFTGDLNGSMADVDHVLKLEPRHFGALEGMATILEHTGFEKRALEVYRRVLAIYPHQGALEKLVDKLTLDVEGQGI